MVGACCRNLGYDGYNTVDAYLNQAHVKKALQADPAITWESCSAEADKILSADVMKSVKNLVSGAYERSCVFF